MRLLHRHEQPVRLAGGWGFAGSALRSTLSADDAIAVLEVMEDGDVLHPSLRSIDAATGDPIAELRDEDLELCRVRASRPLAGDTRIAITHERSGDRRPALWDARTGELHGPRPRPDGLRRSPSTGGPTARRCSCSTSRPAATSCTATTSRPARPDRLPPRTARSRPRRSGPDGTRLVPRPQRRASRAAPRDRRPDARCSRRAGDAAAGGAAVRGVVVREPQGPARPRVPRPARRRRPVPGPAARPRRAALAGHGPLGRRTSWPTSTRASSSRWSTTAAPTASARRGATSSRGTSASWSSRTSSPGSTTSSRAASRTRRGSPSPAGRGAAT